MKSLIIVILGIIVSSSCLAQQAVSFGSDNSIKLSLPNDAVLITKERAAAYSLKAFKNKKVDIEVLTDNSVTKIFLVENKLLHLNSDTKCVSSNHLEETKKGLDEIFKTNPSYKSSINKDANKSILIFSYIIGDIKYYRFISYNNRFNNAATGTLELKKSDEADGFMLMKKILESLEFAN